MSKDNSSLGKGLGSLLGDRPKQQVSGFTEIAIEDLTPGQYQPRKKCTEKPLKSYPKASNSKELFNPLWQEGWLRADTRLLLEKEGGEQHKWQDLPQYQR